MGTTTTPNMTIIKPNPKGFANPQPGPTYAQDNDAALDVIDAHDHTTGKGVKVPVTGLNINANIPLGGNDVTGQAAASFNGQATIATAKTRSVQFDNTTDGDVHIVDALGRDIKLTAAGSLNATLIGGITGDYATTAADLSYDDVTKAYELKQAVAPDHWANAKVGEVHVHEPLSAIVNAVRLKSPLTLAASVDLILNQVALTLPAALPSETELVSMTTAGVLAGDGNHGTREVVVHAASGAPASNSVTFIAGAIGVTLTTNSQQWITPIVLPYGATVVSVKSKANQGMKFELFQGSSGIPTQIGATQTHTTSSGYTITTISPPGGHAYSSAGAGPPLVAIHERPVAGIDPTVEQILVEYTFVKP